ncbi:MAG: O-antigen ligase family protein [Chloroflexi bacterium]|nr:O-antigen ligase family protein [Chloroflexota bacterium]
MATIIFCLVVGMIGGAVMAFLGPILTAVFVMGLVAGGLILRNTQFGIFALVAVVCLLPFAAIPLPGNFPFTPTLLDIALAALFFVWLMKIATGRQETFGGTILGLPIFVFLLLSIASFLAGLSHALPTLNVARQFGEFLLAISLYYVVVNVVREPEQVQQVVSVIILAGFMAALVGVVLYFLPQDLTIRLLSVLRVLHYPSGSDVLRFIEDNPDLPMRATSTSIDPNVFGGLLILVTVITAPQLVSEKPLPMFSWRRLRWRGINLLTVPVLGTMILCMMLTYSRGAFTGMALGLVYLGVFRYRRLLILLAIIALIALFLPQTQWYIQRYVEGIQGEDLATQMRFGEYKDAFILISRYPILGVGFTGTPDIDIYLGVSNMYLLIAEQLGLVGLGLFSLIVVLFFAQTFRWLRAVSANEGIASLLISLQAAVVGALVGGIFDHYFLNFNFPHAVATFWLFIGLTMVVGSMVGETEEKEATL